MATTAQGPRLASAKAIGCEAGEDGGEVWVDAIYGAHDSVDGVDDQRADVLLDQSNEQGQRKGRDEGRRDQPRLTLLLPFRVFPLKNQVNPMMGETRANDGIHASILLSVLSGGGGR